MVSTALVVVVVVVIRDRGVGGTVVVVSIAAAAAGQPAQKPKPKPTSGPAQPRQILRQTKNIQDIIIRYTRWDRRRVFGFHATM
jgi:hypothetical protein